MQILVATLRGAVHQQQRAAAYAALLPSLSLVTKKSSGATEKVAPLCPSLRITKLDANFNLQYDFAAIEPELDLGATGASTTRLEAIGVARIFEWGGTNHMQ